MDSLAHHIFISNRQRSSHGQTCSAIRLHKTTCFSSAAYNDKTELATFKRANYLLASWKTSIRQHLASLLNFFSFFAKVLNNTFNEYGRSFTTLEFSCQIMSPAKYFKPSILTAEPAFRSSFPKVTSAVNLLSPLIFVIQVIDYATELIKGHLQNK